MQLAAPRRLRARSRTGFTLVEIMISLTVLTAAVYLLSSTITATMTHTSKRKERTLAMEAAMNVLERMRAEPFRLLAAKYNSWTKDDPLGTGTAPGHRFDVPGLTPMPENASGMVGEIIMPTDRAKVREDLSMPTLGLPRDLNGDFVIDNRDHMLDYMILPVVVRIEWQGAAGASELEVTSMFSAIQKDLR